MLNLFNPFKSKEEQTKELEAQIDTTKYQLVQGKDGRWAYKELWANDWLLLSAIATHDKMKVVKYILEQQEETLIREKEKANFI